MKLDEALAMLNDTARDHSYYPLDEAAKTLLPIVEAALSLAASPASVDSFEGVLAAVYEAKRRS